jgi:bacterioferritin (cytochrome b1)
MDLKQILERIVKDQSMHSKWLNTLSMMENAGARKIKACEHPLLVSEMILKHASEEARHAYYLKKQLSKIQEGACPTYEASYLLAPKQSQFYLDALDLRICKWLKQSYHWTGYELKYAAYLLVTYAIEVRAEHLYPVYKDVLTSTGSNVKVNTIITEEEGHLKEMKKQIHILFQGDERVATRAEETEQILYEEWLQALSTYCKS